MTGETFEELLRWQKAKSSRAVKVYLEGKSPIQAWVYDYDLGMGQFVTSASEIDLERMRIELLEKTKAELEKSQSMTDQLLSHPTNSG